MLNRIQKFEQETLPLWEEITELVTEINLTGLSTEDRDEIARLKKVVAYFLEMLKAIDPDLIPMKVLDTVKAPISNIKSNLNNYLNTNNITYIRSINNDYLDTLLRDLMPFIFYKGTAGRALHKALSEYSETISTHVNSFVQQSGESESKIKTCLMEIENILQDLKAKQIQINNYQDELFNEDSGIEKKIENLVLDFEDKSDRLKNFDNEVFNERSGLKTQINEYYENAQTNSESINEFKEVIKDKLNELEQFYERIFGNDEETGLKDEIAHRQKELNDLQNNQKDRYNELFNKIESLLPSATSAGLASAYKDMKDKFNKDVKWYGRAFYGALTLLLFIIYGLSMNWFGIPSTSESNAMDLLGNSFILLKSFLLKLPFVLPIIWFITFVSKRRSEAQRLEQEYAHKEALAKSYDSYKQQIEKLSNEEQGKLLPILMENMIQAIALNPAETLNKNHTESTPIEDVIKKKEFWELIEKVKNIIPVRKE